MGQKILVPTDGSEKSQKGLEYAIEEFPEANITVLHVSPEQAQGDLNTFSGLTEVVAESDEIKSATTEVIKKAKNIAASKGNTIDTEVVRGRADREIVRYAGENDIDLIIIGSRGREGIAEVVLGSVAERVVRRSPVSVLVFRG